jgi:hypothetical protein
MRLGHIYVLSYSTGIVKVGCTADPATRLYSHRSMADALGVTVEGEWLSRRHYGYRHNERKVMAACEAAGGVPRRLEYYLGISFSTAVEIAQCLPMPPLPSAPVELHPRMPWDHLDYRNLLRPEEVDGFVGRPARDLVQGCKGSNPTVPHIRVGPQTYRFNRATLVELVAPSCLLDDQEFA